ncbi:MAG: PfkB family carbohydrate kinase [Tepidanaerobacteraceae bacterium]|jgi:pseudouridine kinase
MVTEREREILKWIKDNPMISQEELAKRAGIARSSVAVHISNLMKKGEILGKGYVIRKTPYVLVVGGSSVDIIGYPDEYLFPGESIPGRVELSYGGVGRNQAHNMRLLDLDVKTITVFGEDMYAEKIKQNCQKLGVDISLSLTVPNGITSTYLSIVDSNGECKFGISDMKIINELTPEFLSSKINVINNAKLCVVETNLCKETLEYIAANCQVPLFAEAISIVKAKKLKGILDKIHSLRIDSTDLVSLVDFNIYSLDDVKKAVNKLIDMGVKRVYVSLTSGGIYCADSSQSFEILPLPSVKVVNRTGARDSFIGALAWAFINELDFVKSSLAGLAASMICMESKNVVNEDLNEDYMTSIMQILEGEKFFKEVVG